MLVSTSVMRTWLGLADADTGPNDKLERLILSVQDFIDSQTGRKLEAAVYRTDPRYCYLDGTGEDYIYLPQFPVSHINAVNVDSDRDFGAGTVVSTADIFFDPDNGKLVSEAGYFTEGRRNVLVDYNAGYAPVVGGTWNSAVGTYPVPYDLTQTIIEMVAEALKEGITSVHTVEAGEDTKFIRMLSGKSFWRATINRYKRYDIGF